MEQFPISSSMSLLIPTQKTAVWAKKMFFLPPGGMNVVVVECPVGVRGV